MFLFFITLTRTNYIGTFHIAVNDEHEWPKEFHFAFLYYRVRPQLKSHQLDFLLVKVNNSSICKINKHVINKFYYTFFQSSHILRKRHEPVSLIHVILNNWTLINFHTIKTMFI